jgi:long-chain acyl-CoA synthetase
VGAASFKSFPEMFLHRVSSTPDSDAIYYPDANDDWQTLRWGDVGDRVREIGCGLRSLGLALEERAAILCNTRYEWILIDLGISCARGATTTIYPSTGGEGCGYIIEDSTAGYLFVENDEQLDKILEIKDQLTGLKKIINVDGRGTDDGFVITLDALRKIGRDWHKENPGAYESGIAEVQPDHLATLIYTSGTTGLPKGVELTHDCWVYEAEAMDGLGIMSPADKQYLWLPLSHSFGKVLEAAMIRIGVPTAVDGRLDRIVPNLAVVKPTFVAAVPRIFEKVYNKIVSGAREKGGMTWRVFSWAVDIGRQVSQLKQSGRQPSGALALQYAMADKLVFAKKIRPIFGGRLRFFISGSAPLNRDIAEFFHASGLLILEGYGLTESSAATFVNRPERFKFGSVGMGLPGVNVRLAEEDGEIMLRSRGVMRGYHNKAEATAEALTEDGWLRTGDIGVVDADGFLHITDRKKDLIKTSGGKYVAPQDLEGRLKSKSTLVSQVIVHGDKRNFCCALVTVEPDVMTKWAADNGKSGTYEQLSQDAALHAAIQPAIDAVNAEVERYATIKYFAVLPKDLTVEDGELTPSMKVKRKTVEKKYMDVLDGFYASSAPKV